MTQQKPHIAIVEDDSDQLHSIEEFLLDSGYNVWGADSAEAFYKGFTVRPVDVVILDLGLPDKDGATLLSQWRRRGIANPVLILTARSAWSKRVSPGSGVFIGRPPVASAGPRARGTGGSSPIPRRSP